MDNLTAWWCSRIWDTCDTEGAHQLSQQA
jgi:hypothetical protein